MRSVGHGVSFGALDKVGRREPETRVIWQPDNGHRLSRLGVGTYLYPKAFTEKQVAVALERLTSSPGVLAACRACQARVEKQIPPEDVFNLLVDAHRAGCG
jgi:UDP:flavonoid glycosyltransferase YjiC (YdhE family)